MEWLLILRKTAEIINARSVLMCEQIAKSLADSRHDGGGSGTHQPFLIHDGSSKSQKGNTHCAWYEAVTPRARLIHIRAHEGGRLSPSADEVSGQSLISIWLGIGSSLALDESHSAQVLLRICQVAVRVWDNQPIPRLYYHRKFDNISSVFAGPRSLENQRFTYSVRRVANREVFDVGTIYFANATQGVHVHPVLPNVIEALPASLQPSPAALELVAPNSIQPAQSSSSSGILRIDDFRIVKPATTKTNLFSLTYDQWIASEGPLTNEQRRVILREVPKPLRLHGPAGSGKTLVLILKALWLLREAQIQGKRCHLIVVVTSNAVKNTIRQAIEAIDEAGAFLATSKRDKQFLDVETLHGWCIRELGLESGPARVLERDPKASKEVQLKSISEVLGSTLSKQYAAIKNLLSADFRARIDGKRELLIREIQSEIGIRIKGRGLSLRDRDTYVNAKTRSFIGAKETPTDRHLLFWVFEGYEGQLKRERILDTDDVVLSMGARLASSVWDRQRAELGYDYVFVDETHLFNVNERRVLPLLTRGDSTYPRLVMTFDEAQSIGGRREETSLASLGFSAADSERRNLTVIHRSSPAIYALARDIVDRTPLTFTQFQGAEAVAEMSDDEQSNCIKPLILYTSGATLGTMAVRVCRRFTERGLDKIGIISFDDEVGERVKVGLRAVGLTLHEVEERGVAFAAVSKAGIYLMTPDTCGGLEFEAVLLVGADDGRLPPSFAGVSQEGILSADEDAVSSLYTAVTRARYAMVAMVDLSRGVTKFLRPSIESELIEERTASPSEEVF